MVLHSYAIGRPGAERKIRIMSIPDREIFTVPRSELKRIPVGPISPAKALAWALSEYFSISRNTTRIQLQASRVKLFPHQFKPLMKYYSNGFKAVLLCDEVGLGKTIEAFYILLEEINRGNASRVLILCPSSLEGKWIWEAQYRFGIGIRPKGFDSLMRFLQDDSIHSVAVASLDCLSDQKRLHRFRSAVAESKGLDLVIVDEAHHCIGRGGETNRRQLALGITARSQGTVLLSATPIQISMHDLRRVLDLLVGGCYDEVEFEKNLEKATALNRITIRLNPEMSEDTLEEVLGLIRETETEYDLDLSQIKDAVENHESGSWTERIVAIQSIMSELNPLSQLIVRTTKDDVGLRIPRTIDNRKVSLCDSVDEINLDNRQLRISEEVLFDEGYRLVKEHLAHNNLQQYISSFHGAAEIIRKKISEGLDLSVKAISELEEWLSKFSYLDTDSKFDELLRILQHNIQERPEAKVVLFTHWRPTMAYFVRRQASFERLGYRPIFVQGSSISSYERHRLKGKFREYEGPAVLVTTDVMSEGIDLPEADMLINYDLHYNPQKIEQRIGRIDRITQKADELRIFNVLIPCELNDIMLGLLSKRVKGFEDALGYTPPKIRPARVQATNREIGDEIARYDLMKKQMAKLDVLSEMSILPDDFKTSQLGKGDSVFSELRWIAVVEALRDFASHDFQLKVLSSRDVWVSGVDERCVDILSEELMDPLDKTRIRAFLESHIDGRRTLTISTELESTQWVPPLNHPLFQKSLVLSRQFVKAEENQCAVIAADFMKPKRVVLLLYTVKAFDNEELKWVWWAMDNDGIPCMVRTEDDENGRTEPDECDAMSRNELVSLLLRIARLSKPSCKARVDSFTDKFPASVLEHFSEWKRNAVESMRLIRELQVEAFLKRKRRRLKYIEWRMKREWPESTQYDAWLREETQIRKEIKETASNLKSLSTSSPQTRGVCRPILVLEQGEIRGDVEV